jgi:3-oxoacyl-[acyl-carrier protein] reductase
MEASPGRIVNMSSIMASTGSFGRLGITVNAVAPGFLETELTASKDAKQRGQIARRSAFQRLATVNDVAEAVAFLLSDKAGNITGTVFTIHAGSRRRPRFRSQIGNA